MNTKVSLLCLVVAAVLGIGTAQGRECHGISFPDQVQTEGATLLLNGMGIRQATFLKVNVYVAALYVAKPSSDPAVLLSAGVPYQLILQFVRNVDASDINKGWVEGFERNSHGQVPGLQERIATLRKWTTDIKSGQRLQFTFRPGTGLQLSANGEIKGTIGGDDFGSTFLSIWLGVPPNPEIKIGLLGGACG
jgi:hypothetical protein